MKLCQKCGQTYNDESLNYCLIDGTVLVTTTDNKTAQINYNATPTANTPPVVATSYNPVQSEETFVKQTSHKKSNSLLIVLLILGGLMFICGGGSIGLYFLMNSTDIFSPNSNKNIYSQDTNTGENKKQPSDDSISQSEPTDSKALTIEKFNRIKPNSTYEEAVEILGSEGEQMSSTGSGSYKAEMYRWSGSDTEFIILMFINDKLSSKTQSGFSEIINESLTLEKFNQVKNGMSYEEVAAILGEGTLQSSMTVLNTTVETYQWKADDFSYVSIGFQNGKMNTKTQFGLK